jgi:hypothetical protein
VLREELAKRGKGVLALGDPEYGTGLSARRRAPSTQ